MKRIGVITMHCVVNHGSALQTLATQEIIKRLGYDVKIIDYKYPNEVHPKRRSKPLKRILQCVMHFIQGFPQSKKRKLYEVFWSENFLLTEPYLSKEQLLSNPPVFDTYVSGSDQIWNPIHTNCDGAYFLDFVKFGRKVAFSSSFSSSKLSDELVPKIKEWLSSYYAISVRETNGKEIVDKLLPGKCTKVTLDPTLLLTQKDYQPLIDKSTFKTDEPYILVYCLKYMYNPYPYATRFIEQAAKKFNMRVICIDFTTTQHINAKNVMNFHDGLGPSEFLWLIANAKMVISTSFHGTAFALNFGKSVYSIIKDENYGDDRMKSLLALCGVPERAIPVGKEYVDLSLDIDNNLIQDNLARMREESINYLEENL